MLHVRLNLGSFVRFERANQSTVYAIHRRLWKSFPHLMSGKRYTMVSTKNHTASTKCQYISPATTAQCFFGVKSPRKERMSKTNKKISPTITCDACRPVNAKKHEP